MYWGYDVIEATTGEDGVRLAGERRPDLVLMDLQLPGIDGMEALRQIRAGGARTPGVPVVAVTAFAMNEDRQRAFDGGFDGYVEKPISVRGLPQQVARLPQAGRRAMSEAADSGAARPRGRRPAAEHPAARGDPRRPADTRSSTASSGEEALEVLASADGRPGPPRHRDARHRRLRGVPTDPRAAAHGVPPRRDGDRERRRAEGQGARGGRRRLPHQADRQERAARAGGVAGADQALPGHDQAPGRPSWRRGTSELESRVRDSGRPARADGPAAALPLPAARRADRRLRRRVVPREPPARDRRRLLRPPRLHDVRRGERARGGHGRAAGLPRGARRPDLPLRGNLERFAGDGLMVFFNDPVQCDDGPLARDPDERRHAHAGPRRWPRLGAAGARPGARHRHRPGLRDAREDRLRGPVRLRGDRQRHEPRRPAVRGGRAVADPGHRAGVRLGRGRSWSGTTSVPASCAASAAASVRSDVRGRRQRQGPS